ncbi:phage virion morphogenesis protein [Gallibacterium melopsittaci]|uniref:Phage virion morphogenesis protein n=1 Tax=Gallibacterium melopsittaci TaxID=516063 RepID=A0ABV6HTI6_9PAST
MDNVDELTNKLSTLIANLSPQARRHLAKNIGQKIAQSQRQRITNQQNPDGTSFIPRKNLRKKKGRIKRQKMFVKLKMARYLKAKNTANQVTVGFSGSAANIAAVHQLGKRGVVNEKRNISTQYAKRELLGFTEQDKALVEELIIQWLSWNN